MMAELYEVVCRLPDGELVNLGGYDLPLARGFAAGAVAAGGVSHCWVVSVGPDGLRRVHGGWGNRSLDDCIADLGKLGRGN